MIYLPIIPFFAIISELIKADVDVNIVYRSHFARRTIGIELASSLCDDAMKLLEEFRIELNLARASDRRFPPISLASAKLFLRGIDRFDFA